MSEKNVETMRHSLSHIMAAAVIETFPDAKLAIGPAIENGFYYDFDLPRTLIPEDLPLIEEKMKTIIRQESLFEKSEVSTVTAFNEAVKHKQPYKAELIDDLRIMVKIKLLSIKWRILLTFVRDHMSSQQKRLVLSN